MRFICNRYRHTDSPTELIKNAGLLTLMNRTRLARAKFLHELTHGHLNIDVSAYLTFDLTRTTRQKHPMRLNEYSFNTNCFKYSFFPMATNEWNKLDRSISSTTELAKFLTLVVNELCIMQAESLGWFSFVCLCVHCTSEVSCYHIFFFNQYLVLNPGEEKILCWFLNMFLFLSVYILALTWITSPYCRVFSYYYIFLLLCFLMHMPMCQPLFKALHLFSSDNFSLH